ncbi:MAG TPA: ABC transporter substrate-binding protein [Stellaceae bacterium]|nr:ABC transporter substrate-binding protein [Stellaceae bacterium]
MSAVLNVTGMKNWRFERAWRLLATIVAAALLGASAASAETAAPYEINTILSLTGNIAFVGSTQQKALKALEAYVNRTGGINGRPLSFVVADDQSSAQTAVQLAQDMIAKNVPVIMGSSGPAQCAAITPLVAQHGPVLYCLANGGVVVPGGYEFFTLTSYEAQAAVTVRYLRLRGLTRLATIFSTDAGGQGAEKALKSALDLPENKSVTVVAREHFSPGDVTASAQLSAIRAGNPDALVAWATGPPAGMLFRGARDLGIDLPTVTSPGNLTGAFFKQYAAMLPTNLIFAAVPYYASGAPTDAATTAALSVMTEALAANGTKPDMLTISAWDPAMLVVDTLRKLGPDVAAPKLRDYLANLQGWVGADGPYDFRAAPQRGVGENNIVMVRWDIEKGSGVALSNFGGAPLTGK